MDSECPPPSGMLPRPNLLLPDTALDEGRMPRPRWLFAGTDIAVIGRYLSCQGVMMDFSDREVTLRLFRAFCAAQGGRCSLRDLLRLVYAIGDIETCSPRYLKSARARLIKLISRSRRQLQQHFQPTLGRSYEWFAYDREHRVWILCQPRPVEFRDYLS